MERKSERGKWRKVPLKVQNGEKEESSKQVSRQARAGGVQAV